MIEIQDGSLVFVVWMCSVCVIRRGTSGSLSAKLLSGKPEDFPVSPQLHIYVMPSCSYRVSISIAWTELYGQVTAAAELTFHLCNALL